MTKKKEAEPVAAPLTVDPNPPTEVVPEDSIPLPEEPTGEVPQSAPVWEGGPPAEAVPSPNDTPDAYWPVEEVPPEVPEEPAPEGEPVPVPETPVPEPVIVPDEDD